MSSGLMDRVSGLASSLMGRQALPPLADPQNVESDLSPKDFILVDLAPSETEERIVAMMDDRFAWARDERQPFDAKWMESLAFFGGNQWSRWDARSARMISIIDAREKYRLFVQFNLLIPRVYKLVARAMLGKTDASVSPTTSAIRDVAATAEAQAVLSHLDKIHARDSQNRDMATGCIVLGPHFLKIGFDPTAVVPVPLMEDPNDPTAVTGSEDQEAGEIFEDIVPCTEMYIDPEAVTWKDVRWVIHAKSRPLSYIQERYPERGVHVQADTEDRSFLRAVINSLTGTNNRRERNSATLMELWEKPTLLYPQGRYAVKAGKTLLVNGPWPYRKLAKRRILPFAPLQYRTGILSFWGDNAISACVEPQVCFNRGASRTQEHIRAGTGKILAPRGCEIKPDDFKTGRRDEVIYYTVAPEIADHKPEHWQTPSLDPAVAQSMEQAQFLVDDIMEVHDVSQGGKPPAIDSGVGVIAVQQSDQSASSIFADQFSQYHVLRAEIELSIAGEFYIEPRLLHVQENQDQPDIPGLDTPAGVPGGQGQQSGGPGALPAPGGVPGALPGQPAGSVPFAGANPGGTAVPPFAPSSAQALGQGVDIQGGPQFNPGQAQAQGTNVPMPGAGTNPQAIKAAMQVMSFKALGTGRVNVTASTSSPQTPAARSQTVLNMFKAGMFAPEAIPATLAMLKMMDLEQPDKLVEDIIAKLKEFQSMQPSQMDQAAQQAQIQQMMAQVQTQHDAQLQAIKDHSTAQGKMLDLHHDMLINQQKHQQGQENMAAQHAIEMQKIGAEHQHGQDTNEQMMAQSTAPGKGTAKK